MTVYSWILKLHNFWLWSESASFLPSFPPPFFFFFCGVADPGYAKTIPNPFARQDLIFKLDLEDM